MCNFIERKGSLVLWQVDHYCYEITVTGDSNFKLLERVDGTCATARARLSALAVDL